MRSTPTNTALASLALIAFLSGCAGDLTVDPEDLEVFAAPGLEEDEPAEPRYSLVLRLRLAEGDAEFSSLDLWVPLPPEGSGQRVSSLLYEVAPPATVEGVKTTEAGDRLLHVRSPGRFPNVTIRATIEVRSAAGPDLPEDLSQLSPDLDPPAWVQAALERAHPARLAYGAKLGDGENAVPCRIPELEIDHRWLPVDPSTQRTALPEGTVRVGSSPARAEADGRPLALVTQYSLTPDE